MISGIASIIAAATFIIPLLGTTDLDEGTMSATGYVVLFAMYVVLAYITIFFNAALVSAAHERLGGGDPTIGSALRGAASRAGKILPWAIISATVSMIPASDRGAGRFRRTGSLPRSREWPGR